jgi:hypothetical protein
MTNVLEKAPNWYDLQVSDTTMMTIAACLWVKNKRPVSST